MGEGGGEGSEGESVLPPPPQPQLIDGRAGGGGGKGGRGKVERAPQLKPADTMEGLKQQVMLLLCDV